MPDALQPFGQARTCPPMHVALQVPLPPVQLLPEGAPQIFNT